MLAGDSKKVSWWLLELEYVKFGIKQLLLLCFDQLFFFDTEDSVSNAQTMCNCVSKSIKVYLIWPSLSPPFRGKPSTFASINATLYCCCSVDGNGTNYTP